MTESSNAVAAGGNPGRPAVRARDAPNIFGLTPAELRFGMDDKDDHE